MIKGPLLSPAACGPHRPGCCTQRNSAPYECSPKDRYQTEVDSWRNLQSSNIEFTLKRVNAGEILQRLAGVKVQHGRKQEGPRYRGPSCLSRFIPEGRCPTAGLTGLGVTGAWSERA